MSKGLKFGRSKGRALLNLRNERADRNGLKLFASISESEMKTGLNRLALIRSVIVHIPRVQGCARSHCA